MHKNNKNQSRRQFLKKASAFAALSAAAGAVSPFPLWAQSSSLRIREVKAYPIYINQRSDGLLDAPSFDGDDDPRRWRFGGPFEQLPSAIITIIKTNEGITGFGMGAGGSASVEIIEGHLQHLLLNANPLNVEQLWDQMYTSSIFYGRRGIFAMALSSVDNALWDIAGKAINRPVSYFFGGPVREEISYFGFPQGQSASEVANNAKGFVKMGHDIIYIKEGMGVKSDIETIKAVRSAIGPDKRLRVDPNEHWGTLEMRQILPQVLDCNIECIEQPTHCESISALKQVRNKSSIPIAADQLVFSPQDCFDVCKDLPLI